MSPTRETAPPTRSPYGDYNGRSEPPDSPTDARPGTPEKLAVMGARAAAGVGLFHPKDASRDECGPADRPAATTGPEEPQEDDE